MFFQGKEYYMGKVTDHVRKVFDDKFPFCLISNVILYRGDRNESDLYANEIDFLFHYLSSDGLHHLVIIEVKDQSLSGYSDGTSPMPDGPWYAQYGEKKKDVKQQISNQVKALKQFCRVISKNDIDIEGWVIDNRSGFQSIQINQNFILKLLTREAFSKQLESLRHVFRIEHSEFLRELRRGMALPDTGHPEIPSAIRFIQKCRETLDIQLYSFFQPTENFYAINGCAGMGKSVLLAYGIYVLATDYCCEIDQDGSSKLISYKDKANRLNWHERDSRRIYAFAVKEKQVKALKNYFDLIKDQLSCVNKLSLPATQVPQFAEWKGNIPVDCNCLVIDESHDLSLDDQKKIALWVKQPGRFLMVACDRNQAVKRKEDEQYIIQGIDFSRHTRRLNRIYRCPFPVYVAAVGLLFRWFANQNIAVTIHTNQELSSCFGFKTIPRQENQMTTFSMRNDSHPGNNWQQTVSYFNTPKRAYDFISQFAVNNDDVLWACFKRTSKQFDYAKLQQKFTWVDLTSEQAEDEIDKHIKGQEFPIVFVEGMPPNMNPPDMVQNTNVGSIQKESERTMWQARKNLYIVCSRASAFLYFVSRIDSIIETDINLMELKELIHQVSRPIWNEYESGKTWTFTIKMPAISRHPKQFMDLKEAVEQLPPEPIPIKVPPPIFVPPEKQHIKKRIYIQSLADWVYKGVTFPVGTKFRADYNGDTFYGQVQSGQLVIDGKEYKSPSAAAGAVTGNSVNGWIFWECQFPDKLSWQSIDSLRKKI
jgi:hypothetical protein